MKRKRVKALYIVLISAGCILVIMAGLYYGLVALANDTQKAYEGIGSLDLGRLEDGVYNGRAGGFICSVDLDVSVKDHRMTDISINRQISGGSYQARDMSRRIVEAQSLDVDVVSGATLSSKTIAVAVYKALVEK